MTAVPVPRWCPATPPWLPRRPPPRSGTRAGSSHDDQAVLQRVDHQFGGFVQAQRIHDVRAMHRYRVDAEIERRGDLPVRQTIANQLQDFELAYGQAMVIALQGGRSIERRIDDRLAGGDALDGGDEVEIDRALEDVAARSRRERLADEGFLRMHAEHQHRRVWRLGQDLTHRFESDPFRHGAIHDDDARPELAGELDRFAAIAGFADDRDGRVVFEQAPKAAADETVIVGEQHRDAVRHVRPLPPRSAAVRARAPVSRLLLGV